MHLNNSIVILDEAHNIEDTCREAASFSFSENEAYVASKELLLKGKLSIESTMCPRSHLRDSTLV